MNIFLIGNLLIYFAQIQISKAATPLIKNIDYSLPVLNDGLDIQYLSLEDNQFLYSEVGK
jgi:hypothetical protein